MTNACAYIGRGQVTYLFWQVIPTTSDTDKRPTLFRVCMVCMGSACLPGKCSCPLYIYISYGF